MDRISLRCRNGHADIEVMGFIRRTEAEALSVLNEGADDPSEAAISRALDRANNWVVDNSAPRRSDHVRGPRRLSANDEAPRSEIKDGMVFPRCPKCGDEKPVNGVRLKKLQPVLDQLWSAGAVTPTLQNLVDILRLINT